MKDPLVGPVAAIAAGILVSRFVPFHQSELLTAIGAFCALAGLSRWRKAHVLAATCTACALFFAGALTALWHTPVPAPSLDVEGREVVILGGCVVEPPAISSGRERFLLELDKGARAQVTLYTRKDGETLPPLRYGQDIELNAQVRKPRNYGNPGAFDYAHYLARKDIYWTVSAAASTVRILPGHCGTAFSRFVMDLRASALARIDRIWGRDTYSGGMMQAVLLGQTFQMQRIWTEDYRNTGTFHALVISGTHVAILAAFFLFLLRLCFIPESLSLLLTAMAAWLYALVSGWGAPCVRSAAGLTLYMIGSYFYRDRRPLNLLAAVALGFLVMDPDQLFDASFQLTFLAVAFLGAFATPLIAATTGPLSRGLADLANRDRDLHAQPRVAQFRIEMRLLAETLTMAVRLPRRISQALVSFTARLVCFFLEVTLVSAVIQIGLALPMVVYFHRVGLSGLSANALVVPVMGLVVPVGFVALFTGWSWAAHASGWLLWLSRAIVRWHAAVEPHWRIPTPPLWVALAFSVSLIAAAMARRTWSRAAAGVAVATSLALLLWSPFPADGHRGQLELTAIDVGQGDSLLVVFPDGKRLLVDGGGIPQFGHAAKTQLDIGEDVVAPYLWDRGLHNVDVIALSHAHEDHIGGLPALVGDFRPAQLWTGATPESAGWDALRAEAVRDRVKIQPLTAPARFAFGGAEIEVLAPLPDYQPADTPKNNDSLVLRIRYGCHSFLLCGDVERQVEYAMLDAGEIGHDDVLKVAHHGSHTSSTGEFLAAVHPAFAIISAGLDNSYGHPHRDVVQRLEDTGAAILRTDQDGQVSVRSDGRRLYVERYRDRTPSLQTAAPWAF